MKVEINVAVQPAKWNTLNYCRWTSWFLPVFTYRCCHHSCKQALHVDIFDLWLMLSTKLVSSSSFFLFLRSYLSKDQHQSSRSIISLCWLELQCHFNLQPLKQNLSKCKGNTWAISLHSARGCRSHTTEPWDVLKTCSWGCSSETELGHCWGERETPCDTPEQNNLGRSFKKSSLCCYFLFPCLFVFDICKGEFKETYFMQILTSVKARLLSNF